jgi:hypothetical protein
MLLDEIAAYLQAEGIGTVGTTLFKGSVPQDAPLVAVQDALVALIEGPGLPPLRVHTPRADTVEQPTVQIVVRGDPHGYPAARQKAHDTFVALDGLANVTLGSGFYLWVLALQSPFFLRSDDLHRPYLVFNVRVAKAL